jgi:hypothetical protein
MNFKTNKAGGKTTNEKIAIEAIMSFTLSA